jgi:hypothetical protein
MDQPPVDPAKDSPRQPPPHSESHDGSPAKADATEKPLPAESVKKTSHDSQDEDDDAYQAFLLDRAAFADQSDEAASPSGLTAAATGASAATPARSKSAPASQQPQQTDDSKAATAQSASTTATFYVYSYAGQQYGPAQKADLDRWVAEGRITAACQIHADEATGWKPAGFFYPQLQVTTAINSLSSGQASSHPPLDIQPVFIDSAETAAELTTQPGAKGSSSLGQLIGNHQPLLSTTGRKKSIANLVVKSELKKVNGAELISSDIYRIGKSRGLLARLRAASMVGPIKESEIAIDEFQLFHMRDAGGEFAMILPFDHGMIAPLEYVALMPGRLSDAIVLLKQSGGKLALEAGILIGGPLGSLLERAGKKVEAVWAGCDGAIPPIAEQAQAQPELAAGINWDGKVGGGPVKNVYRIDWGIQAIPLNDSQYLLIAHSVPKQKMIGFRFAVDWFAQYRQQFAQLVQQNRSAKAGRFQVLDPGVWLPTSIEVLKWIRA